jgi:hypothetical protein
MVNVGVGLQRPPDGVPEALMLEKAALPLMLSMTMP